MTHHLGHAAEAPTCLDWLRALMKNPKIAENKETQAFLQEAETLVSKGSH